jgi:hypothetical protein
MQKTKAIPIQYVTLQPGETLFIPPGYLVHTEAQNMSVYMDVLSPSIEQVIFLETMSLSFPFPGNLTKDERIVYGQVRIIRIIIITVLLTS